MNESALLVCAYNDHNIFRDFHLVGAISLKEFKSKTNPYFKAVNNMEKEKHEKKRLAAELCSCVDDKKSSLHLEFTLPGIKKEDINLKMSDGCFSLRAEKNDVEYVSTGKFCCPVEINQSEANYENGLLLVNIPMKDPWKDAYDVIIH
ncbi:MAG: Hsp20/alpha crystallin family protein [Desulfobacterium sp.]